MKKRYLALALASLMSCTMFVGCANSSSKDDEEEKDAYMEPIDDFLNAITKADGEKLMKCIYTDEVIDDNFEDYDKDEIEDFYENMSEELEDILEDLEDDYGKDIKFTFKKTDKTKLDDDELEDYEELYSDYYDSDVTAKKGYLIEGTLKVKGADDSEEDELECIVVEIKGDGWYLHPDCELVEEFLY